ncbi:MAG: hypothetical protein RI897_915 [Verrucomicrobiota bacterium]|jgi:arylsulfatase A-like enzyme
MQFMRADSISWRLCLLIQVLWSGFLLGSDRPNLVFFLVDDMGWQETSVAFHSEATPLNRRYRTPNMERLAREGMKFTQAYASAVCSPSRVSALTGMNVARHGVTNWTLRKDASPDNASDDFSPPNWNVNGVAPAEGVSRTVVATPLPELLREAGYATIHVGKAHFGALGTPGEDPLNLGFDVNIAGHCAGGPGSYWGEKNYSAAWRTDPPDRIWDVPGLDAYHGTGTYLTEALTREAIKAVESVVEERKPFYLYLSHYAVHAPWERDSRFYEKYVDAGLSPFEATLASMIEGMDKSLGDVLGALERLGVADNTMIVFMSDNGSPSQCPRNLPLRGHKLTPYEGGIREPMLVWWPGRVRAGGVCSVPVIIEDLFPTLLEVAGVEWEGRVRQVVDGKSIVPLLTGEGAGVQADRDFIWHFPHLYSGQGPFSAIRRGDRKLIFHHVDRRVELFDLQVDLSEQHNLAKVNPEFAAALCQRLGERLAERGALMPFDRRLGRVMAYPATGDVSGAATAAGRRGNLPVSAIAAGLEWRGVAIADPDYTVWGAAPLRAGGEYHLYAARWPEEGVDPAWRRSSEIAHYVSERPEGPFRFADVVLRGTGLAGDWDAYAPHNPEVREFDGGYYLCYIANDDYHQPPHPLNQRIGMASAPSPYGPWDKVGGHGLILSASGDPGHFTYGKQVVNPTLLRVGERYHLYFKTGGEVPGSTLYGLAISEAVTGPYRMLDHPLTSRDVTIEDGSAFLWQGKVCLLTTDNHGQVTGLRGGGVLWVSDDGIHFNPDWTQRGFGLLPDYYGGFDSSRVVKIYGGDPKFERPKVLCEGGAPAWFYGTSGWNVMGGDRTVSHVLRIQLSEGAGPLSGLR